MQTAPRRHYDHRIRRAVVASRNVRLFPDLDIPVSTARSWITRGSRRVVTAVDDTPDQVATLRAEIVVLRSKPEMYLAVASASCATQDRAPTALCTPIHEVEDWSDRARASEHRLGPMDAFRLVLLTLASLVDRRNEHIIA